MQIVCDPIFQIFMVHRLRGTLLKWRLKKWHTQMISAASCQNQQNDLCTQWRHRSDWADVQSDQSSLCTLWVAKDLSFLQADSEDSDQTEQMSRLILVFAACMGHFVGCAVVHLGMDKPLEEIKADETDWQSPEPLHNTILGVKVQTCA